MPAFPFWLHVLAVASLLVAVLCAAVIVVDELRHPQPMAVMNLVWPLCALFGSLIWLGAYIGVGRAAAKRETMGETPMPVAVFKGSSHCGAGCALGDLAAESLGLAAPGVAVAFGLGWLFSQRTFALWVLDFLLAYVFGVGFQYFALKPGAGRLARAVKVDTASICAWQIGMFGFMALFQFAWARPRFGAPASAIQPEFWLAMQLAMLCGFVCAYPVNWLLIAKGVKERM